MAAQPSARPAPELTERLWVPWWGWLLALIVAAVLAAEVHSGYPGLRAWLPYVVAGPLAVGIMLWLGRHRIQVSDDELIAGPARLPLRHVGTVEVLSGAAKRRALGPELDPSAYLVHRAWIPAAVRLQLTDPADPTPYWLISTRHPERLAALLARRNQA